MTHFPFGTFYSDHCIHSGGRKRLRFTFLQLQTHRIQLIGIRFRGDIYQIERILLTGINVERTSVAGELPATDIFYCRKINFHLRCPLADNGDNGHTGRNSLMGIEKTFLYISAERSIQTGIFQLIFRMIVLGGYLFQPVHRFIIGVGSRYILLIKCHHTLRLRLHTLILRFRSIQLNLIISRVQFGKQLSFAHIRSVVDVHTQYSSAYTE